ncbi:hypothetical protein [Pseudonocardia humida]|uniref:Restriction system protein n=1 Tax=Pseudonocardia humida TaxID=2800819 RepID=A0ABT0ZZR1_9PSEU|nr:hypothetical protein [Pseudonocardia humida]MCO1656232.1 hypothetical protein [Pseudonocardia humida]
MAREQGGGADDRARRRLAQERQRSRTMEAAARRTEREVADLRSALRRVDAQARTLRVEREVAELDLLLLRGLRRSPVFDWDRYRRHDEPEALDLGPDAVPQPGPVWEAYAPAGSGALDALLTTVPGTDRMRRRRTSIARQRFEQARFEHERAEIDRRRRVREREVAHRASVAEHHRAVEKHNRDWRELRAGVLARDPGCVARLLGFVLRELPLPVGFPRAAEVGCSPDAREAAVRVELPTAEVVPAVVGYTASAELDEPAAVPRTAEQVGVLYRSVLTQITLLQLRELFGVDPGLGLVRLTGYTGDGTALLRVETDRAAFDRLGLGAVIDADAGSGGLGIEIGA